MLKERLISELCDFGVIYSLYVSRATSSAPSRAFVKISWEDSPAGEVRTHSSVFELDLKNERLRALGRKGNQLPAEHFSAEKICAWARLELQDAEY
jgi:hypothetical protein